jgi:glycosyltransferase XagB
MTTPLGRESALPMNPTLDRSAYPRTDAATILSRGQKIRLALLAAGAALLFLWDYVYFFYLLNFLICLAYFVVTLFKFSLIALSAWRNPQIRVSAQEAGSLGDADLPIYTVLLPLYKEANVAGSILHAIESLDYPRDKLDVKLLLEPDDAVTREALERTRSPLNLDVVLSPAEGPRTKPKACNQGLLRSRGEYVVVYDAEDRPAPDQLKKAVAAFRRMPERVACLQCKLNYYNPLQNWLTRFFTVEYVSWFEFFLPGLHRFDMPIPLGGTSNHFRAPALKALGGWDPYNLTEDCDLGIRLHMEGYRTRILDSTTWEEANSRLGNWIRQRSRWVKGYIQTYLVLMRHPVRLFRRLGPKGFLGFLLTVGGFTGLLLLNPVYWVIAGLYPFFRWQIRYPGDPVSEFFFVAALTLAFANLLFVLTNVLAALKHDDRRLLPWAILSPFYWILISIGAWKGFLQLFANPFYWERTRHGLTGNYDEA